VTFTEARNHFSAQASQDTAVDIAGQLKTMAVGLSRIANDIRWLGSGPRGGIGELRLPALQPGSSIMPGKVNPVACEAVIQACTRVVANDSSVTQGAFGGVGSLFELNLALPLIADALLDSVQCVARAAETLTAQVVQGLEVDEARCRELLERSLMMVTRLVPEIGYDQASEVAKTALEQDQSIRDVVLARGLIEADVLDELLNPERMT
jgi:fumarate hydratase class II